MKVSSIKCNCRTMNETINVIHNNRLDLEHISEYKV